MVTKMILAMSDIKALTEIDYVTVILGVFVLLFAVKGAIMLMDWFCERFGIKTKKMQDHELLIKTSQNLALLQEKHEKDTAISDEHDSELKELITDFIQETRTQMDKIAYDRINDREKSREIRAELANSIKIIADANEKNHSQINNLTIAQREVLADRINHRYKKYIKNQGIPEDEYDEFINLHSAYKACGGNSSGDAKFDYCINHLPVLPVETKLVIKHDN
jgi:hypothetical protein